MKGLTLRRAISSRERAGRARALMTTDCGRSANNGRRDDEKVSGELWHARVNDAREPLTVASLSRDNERRVSLLQSGVTAMVSTTPCQQSGYIQKCMLH